MPADGDDEARLRAFCARLRELLHPLPLQVDRSDRSPEIPLLLSSHGWTVRYALGVIPWQPGHDPRRVIRWRQTIAKALGALPAVRDAACYLLITGDADRWTEWLPTASPEWVRFGAVTLRAFHFVDLATGQQALRRVGWRAIRDPAIERLAGVVEAVLPQPDRSAGVLS